MKGKNYFRWLGQLDNNKGVYNPSKDWPQWAWFAYNETNHH